MTDRQHDELYKILGGALLGTAMMTAFSYAVSHKKHRRFKEPELLNILIDRMPGHLKKNTSGRNGIMGWGLHFIVGVLFNAGYSRIWKNMTFSERIAAGVSLGALSGVIGAAGWKAALDLHPRRPLLRRKRYYGHLTVAHVMFGTFSALGYSLVDSVRSADHQFRERIAPADDSTQKMRTLAECMNDAKMKGYTEEFKVVDRTLVSADARKIFLPDEVAITNFYRFEGYSDPGDNSILYLIETTDKTRGLLVDAYDAYADEDVSVFFREVEHIQKQPRYRSPIYRLAAFLRKIIAK